MSAQPIYLDNNATTRPLPEVMEAMAACLRDTWGNPSSMHAAGAAAKAVLNRARAQVAALLNAAPAEIVFTSGATESNHTAILGALSAQTGKTHIVASAVEHPSSLKLLEYLEGLGFSVTRIGVDAEGAIDPSAFATAIRPDTALVSLMWANNETGAIHSLAEVAELCRARGVLCHTDAVQALGRLETDVRQVPVDLLSFSAHKLHGPSGVGALYIRKGVSIGPLLHGHQERKRRGGTENLPGIAGFGVAAEILAAGWRRESLRVGELRDRFEAELLSWLPLARVNAQGVPRLSNTSNFRLGDIDAEIVLDRLDKAGIQASSGSACTAGGTEPSHVLAAMGQDETQALAAVRFSFGRDNALEDVARVIGLLRAIAESVSGSQAVAA